MRGHVPGKNSSWMNLIIRLPPTFNYKSAIREGRHLETHSAWCRDIRPTRLPGLPSHSPQMPLPLGTFSAVLPNLWQPPRSARKNSADGPLPCLPPSTLRRVRSKRGPKTSGSGGGRRRLHLVPHASPPLTTCSARPLCRHKKPRKETTKETDDVPSRRVPAPLRTAKEPRAALAVPSGSPVIRPQRPTVSSCHRSFAQSCASTRIVSPETNVAAHGFCPSSRSPSFSYLPPAGSSPLQLHFRRFVLAPAVLAAPERNRINPAGQKKTKNCIIGSSSPEKTTIKRTYMGKLET